MRKRHVHRKCVQQALERAEKICNQHGCRFTPIRKKVLELIWQSHTPVKAYDILAQLSSDDFVEKPPTVYRALEFLLENHLIHRIESQNSYIGCEFEHDGMDSKFFICDHCNEVEEMLEPRLNQALNETSRRQGFTPKLVNMEIHGMCAQCAR